MRVISEYGKEYEIAIIPLDEDEGKVSLHIVSTSTEPYPQGWYVGRNESTVHEAITVSRNVCGVKDFRFRTLLIPVEAGEPLPVVQTCENGVITVSVGGKSYRLDSACVKSE